MNGERLQNLHFQNVSSPTNFVLFKQFRYQNVRLLEEISARIRLLHIIHTFQNILTLIIIKSHSNEWEKIQVF